MYVVAASFVGFFAFTIYTDSVEPESAGTEASDYALGNLHLQRVARASPLERAGVRDDDRILAADGRPIRTLDDWGQARSLFRTDRPIDLEIERKGSRLRTELVLRRGTGIFGAGVFPVEYLVWRGSMFSFILVSFFVFLRPNDLSARLASLTLAALAALVPMPAVTHVPGHGWAAAWRSLPWPLAVLFAIPALSVAILPLLVFAFVAAFPRDYFSSRHRLLAWCVPGLLTVPLIFHGLWPMYDPPAMLRIWQRQAWLVSDTLALLYGLAGLLIFVAKYRRLHDQNERRRMRALASAFLIIGVLGLHRTAALNWTRWFGTTPPAFVSSSTTAVGAVLFQFVPLSLAYAILRHRIFDISFVVRRGIQYLLARRVLVSMLPALGLLLLLDAAVHRDQTIGAVVSQRGWLYAIVGAAALIARQKQQQWLDVLDRRFFRERYNAERLLRETAEEIRQASSLEHVATRAVARIESSLHPEFAALLVRGPEETAYHTLASAPAGFSPPLMQADSKLVGLLRLLGKPLQIASSDSGWLTQQLPHADTAFLRQARIDLLVPVSLSAFNREALLVLGPKKSEEPYGSDDQELLVAIANGLALLLERSATPASSSGLEECPRCGSCYDSGIGRCSEDGTKLAPSVVPRVLAGRYRLDRRLGRGGMGTVYRALDTSLERQVALKLIREELVASADAAERFRREAKAAAAITHPNLVTLHDFAVDGSRAFLVMELLSGRTLRQHMRQEGRLTPAATLEILRGACAALSVAHERGLVHRDLKPENIFLVADGGRTTPKILDFGLAKFVNANDVSMQATTLDTGAGVLVGTPRYMSPEQLTGKPVSRSWDLWALAVIIYEMLSGACPFGNPDMVAALHVAILSGHYAPIQTHVPEAPVRWQEFFTRNLAVEVARRSASALEFLSECEKAFA